MNFWHWLTTTKYTRLLEDEVFNLRIENMGLKSENRTLVEKLAPVLKIQQTTAGEMLKHMLKQKPRQIFRVPSRRDRRYTLAESMNTKENRIKETAAQIERAHAGQFESEEVNATR